LRLTLWSRSKDNCKKEQKTKQGPVPLEQPALIFCDELNNMLVSIVWTIKNTDYYYVDLHKM